MKKILIPSFSALALAASVSAADPEAGFKSIFNGKDLAGWEGNPDLWSVQDGAITGVTKAEPKLTHNTFLVYTNGEVTDFELRLSYRIVAGNSGIQYRSKVVENGKFGPIVAGYQADFEAGKTYSGILYEEKGRGILAQRGQKTVIKPEADDPKRHRVDVVGSLGKSEEIQQKIKSEDWNDYVVIAQGNHFQHFINGAQTVDVTDEHEAKAAKSGILALQIHVGPPMTVQFKNVRLKPLSGQAAARSDLEQLQGDWVPVELVGNGESASAEKLASFNVTIKDNDYFVKKSDGTDQGSFKVLETTSPRAMDVTTHAGDRIEAIYEISGDTFRACYAIDGAARPTEFKSTEGSNHVLAVYKRKP